MELLPCSFHVLHCNVKGTILKKKLMQLLIDSLQYLLRFIICQNYVWFNSHFEEITNYIKY